MTANFYRIEELSAGFGPCALTIGNFDGVHRGHQAILRRVVEQAARLGVESVALTFDPHPLAIVAPERAPGTLTTASERTRHILALGINRVVVLPFTKELSQFTPEEFVARILNERLSARHVTVGDNFRFGHRHAGDVAELRRLGTRFGFETEALSAVEIDGIIASSSRLRDCAKRGDMRCARRILGRPFSLTGEIVRGEGIGSKQTVPTLNLNPDSEVYPADGVYVTITADRESGRCWESITNVGVRPTFNGKGRTVETNILSGLTRHAPTSIELQFLKRLRPEQTFGSAALLKEQILKDIGVSRRYFAKLRAVGEYSASVS